MIVLDASALLAYMFRESGAQEVATVIGDCCISAVNIAEVLGRFVRDGYDAKRVLKEIRTTAIEVVDFDPSQAEVTAQLIMGTHRSGLSLGDRACLALALSRRLPVMTADRAWKQLKLDIDIRLIR
jgi:ribonuclease VapC